MEHELVIIGGGPAALSAALYAGRAGIAARIYESQAVGGTLNQIPQLENYPGYQGSGASLTAIMKNQAVQAGASLAYGECTALRYVGAPANLGSREMQAPPAEPVAPRTGETSPVPHFELTIDGEPILARAVIVATGSVPRRLDFELNIPISYCALCDGTLAAGKHIVVVGGANSAAQEALYLAGLVGQLKESGGDEPTSVTLISHSSLKADSELQKRLRACPNVQIIENVEPTAALLNQYDYCFVNIGRTPATGFLQELSASNIQGDQRVSGQHADESLANDSCANGRLAINSPVGELLDSTGYLLAPGMKTAIPGLFAAGDVRAGAVRQIITACADGAQAALLAADFLRQMPN